MSGEINTLPEGDEPVPRKIDYRVLRDWIFIALILAIGIYIVIFLKSEANMCMKDPLTYGIIKLNEANKANITCNCGDNSMNNLSCFCSDLEDKKEISFFVDREGIHFITKKDVVVSSSDSPVLVDDEFLRKLNHSITSARD